MYLEPALHSFPFGFAQHCSKEAFFSSYKLVSMELDGYHLYFHESGAEFWPSGGWGLTLCYATL